MSQTAAVPSGRPGRGWLGETRHRAGPVTGPRVRLLAPGEPVTQDLFGGEERRFTQNASVGGTLVRPAQQEAL